MSNGFLPFEEEKTIAQKKEDGDWPPEWISTKFLVPYIKRLGKEINVLEIGTGKGESAYYLLEICPNIKNLLTIDPYKEYQDWNGVIDQATLDIHKKVAYENLSEFEGRAWIEETFNILVKEDSPYDVLFIDGDHAFDAVLNDLNQTYQFVKVGGIVAVHDTNLRTVLDAVYKFRDDNKIRSTINMVANSTLFWYKEK